MPLGEVPYESGGRLQQHVYFRTASIVSSKLCRWLLSSLDRLSSDSLTMTQEPVANMLGVRREAVTEAAGDSQPGGCRVRSEETRKLARPVIKSIRTRLSSARDALFVR